MKAADQGMPASSSTGPLALSLLRRNLAFAAVLLVTTTLYLVIALHLPLAEDETYYWDWSRRLDWGYHDQGPMIAWWIRGTCALLGESEMGIRVGIVAAFLLSQLIAVRLAIELFGREAALWTLLAFSVTPLGIAGAFAATYDSLLALFWTAGLYAAHKAVSHGRLLWWLALGVAFGLGMLSKHSMAFFAVCLALFLVTRPDWRMWLARPHPWLALALGALIYLPNVLWNASHDWVTYRHLAEIGGISTKTSAGARLIGFVASQAAIVTPILATMFVLAIVWACRRRTASEGAWFLFCFSGPILALFAVMTIRSKVLPNWAAYAWIAATLLFGAWVVRRESDAPSARRRRLVWSAAAIALSLALAAFAIFPEGPAALGVRVPLAATGPILKTYGGRELGRAADRELDRMTRELGEPIAIGATRYQVASRLAFYMSSRPNVCCLFLRTRLNQYALWNEVACPPAEGAMLIASDQPPGSPEHERIRAAFDRVEPAPEPVDVFRRSVYREPIRTYYLLRCYGFRPDAAPPAPSAY